MNKYLLLLACSVLLVSCKPRQEDATAETDTGAQAKLDNKVIAHPEIQFRDDAKTIESIAGFKKNLFAALDENDFGKIFAFFYSGGDPDINSRGIDSAVLSYNFDLDGSDAGLQRLKAFLKENLSLGGFLDSTTWNDTFFVAPYVQIVSKTMADSCKEYKDFCGVAQGDSVEVFTTPEMAGKVVEKLAANEIVRILKDTLCDPNGVGCKWRVVSRFNGAKGYSPIKRIRATYDGSIFIQKIKGEWKIVRIAGTNVRLTPEDTQE